MSKENVELVRRIYLEWARGNFGVGGDLFTPDAVFEPFPEGSAIHGLPSIGTYMRAFLQQWSAYRVEGEEFTEVGDSVIVVRERQYAKGRSSGLETVQTFYAVWTFQQGRVARVRWESERGKALEAAGLPH